MMQAMPNVLVRDLPEEVHRRLVERAQAGGRSLQQYLVAELTRLAEAVGFDELVARIESNEGGRVGLAQAVSDLEQARGRK